MRKCADARRPGRVDSGRTMADPATAIMDSGCVRVAGYLSLGLAVVVLVTGCAGPGEETWPAAAGDLLPVRCAERLTPGVCGPQRPAFWYDYASDRCRPVTDGGCGQVRPFAAMAECIQVCGARKAP